MSLREKGDLNLFLVINSIFCEKCLTRFGFVGRSS